MKTPASKSSLFLLELILSIFFFSIASGVCIQLFVKAHFLGVETKEINQATLWSQNVAEAFYASDDINEIEVLFPFHQDAKKNSYVLYFDRDWNIMDTSAVYALTFTVHEDSSYQYADISITKNTVSLADNSSEELYQLPLKKYLQNRSVKIHE